MPRISDDGDFGGGDAHGDVDDGSGHHDYVDGVGGDEPIHA